LQHPESRDHADQRDDQGGEQDNQSAHR
jgi:hypothetical protein